MLHTLTNIIEDIDEDAIYELPNQRGLSQDIALPVNDERSGSDPVLRADIEGDSIRQSQQW